MAPVKSTKSNDKDKEGTKGYEDHETRIQGLENSVITMTAVHQKGVDDSDTRFERMFKGLTAHKSGTAHMLRDYELAASAESEKAEQDRKVTASSVLAELASTKNDAHDACAAATNAKIKTEDDTPSPERVESTFLGLNPDSKPKRVSPSHLLTNPCLRHQHGNWKWCPASMAKSCLLVL